MKKIWSLNWVCFLKLDDKIWMFRMNYTGREKSSSDHKYFISRNRSSNCLGLLRYYVLSSLTYLVRYLYHVMRWDLSFVFLSSKKYNRNNCRQFPLSSAESLLDQGYQLLLSFVGWFDVVNKLSKLDVAVIGEKESLPCLAEKIDELSVVPWRYWCQSGVCGGHEGCQRGL